MNLLYPLGLLGLIGIIVLLIIYILKPNYQQRILSSTHVWKLSLKYRRSKFVVNRFRNLIILLCQILIITAGAFILARPYLPEYVNRRAGERIIVIDASASMLAKQGSNTTRFERAVVAAKELSSNVISGGNSVSVILAAKTAQTLILSATSTEDVDTQLDALLALNEMSLPIGCSFGDADVDGAMEIAEGCLALNPSAKVVFYTATNYEKSYDHVLIENMFLSADDLGDDKEWNAAILDCRTEYSENVYKFSIDVASYNNDEDINVIFEAYGVNGDDPEKLSIVFESVAQCRANSISTIHLNNLKITSYSRIYIYLNLDKSDSFIYDNHYYLFDGEKEELWILYCSPKGSNFYESILYGLAYSLNSRWNINFDITSLYEIEDNEKELIGYDFYIFEYYMPDILPTDGFVLMVSPDKAPQNSGLMFGDVIDVFSELDELCRLKPGVPSQLMNSVDPSNILVNRYQEIISYDSDYLPLMYFNSGRGNDPVFLLKNTEDSKMGILAFASSFSDFTVTFEFTAIIYNIVNILFPPTLKQYVYDVGSELTFDQNLVMLKEMSPQMRVVGGWIPSDVSYSGGNYAISSAVPGPYSMTQEMLSGDIITESFYVKVSSLQSDFTRNGVFTVPYLPGINYGDFDIYIYFAACLCAIIFIERLLHVKEEY